MRICVIGAATLPGKSAIVGVSTFHAGVVVQECEAS